MFVCQFYTSQEQDLKKIVKRVFPKGISMQLNRKEESLNFPVKLS